MMVSLVILLWSGLISGRHCLYYQVMNYTNCPTTKGGDIVAMTTLSGSVDQLVRGCLDFCDITPGCVGGGVKIDQSLYGRCFSRSKCDQNAAEHSSTSISFLKCSVVSFNSNPNVSNVDETLTDGDPSTCVKLTPNSSLSWGYETQCVDISMVSLQFKGNCNGRVPTVYIINRSYAFTGSQCGRQIPLFCPVTDRQVLPSGVCEMNYNCASKQQPQRYGWDRVLVYQPTHDICELKVS